MNEIRFVDTTLRDGQLSLWASNMRTGMMLPIAERLDRAGFEAIEIMASAFYKKCVRDLKEDPWERLRLMSKRIKRTPLRTIRSRSMLAFQIAGDSALDSFMATWRLWSPATPMLAVLGWGIMFLLDPSHRVRHAQLELEADQADIYASRLKAAAKSPAVDETIRAAANEVARQFSETLNHAYVPSANGKRANGQPAGGQREMNAGGDGAFPKRSKTRGPKG